MKEGIEKQVEGYLDEVGLYSREHREYIDKLNRVLDEMKVSSNSTERNHYNAFKETVSSFAKYMEEKKIRLTRHEKERFAVISSSGLGNLAKKRMAEDLIRSVRERHSADSAIKVESEKRKQEISALSKSPLFIVNWFRMLRYAIDYGTITPFSHEYKGSSFDILRTRFVSWYRGSEAEIFRILDEYYYYLSTLEYNSLVKLAEAGSSAERFNEVKPRVAYDPAEIYDYIEDFTSKYIAVITNTATIDKALKKALKERQPGHGFWGHIGSMTDRPLQNNMVVRMTGVSMMRNTVCGALYSFYSAHFGVRVTTFTQLMHLANEDGSVEAEKKQLTQGAVQRVSDEESKKEDEDFKLRSRLDELNLLVSGYRESGRKIAERLSLLDKISSYGAGKEQPNRPLAKMIRIIDGYIRTILDPVAGNGGFGLEYDGAVTDTFFSRHQELRKAVEDFIAFTLELQGSRGKDLAALRVLQAGEGDSLVQVLADTESELPRIEGARALRETLSLISSKTYNICNRFHGLITAFNTTGRNEPPEYMDRYDYAINSRLKHSKLRTIENLLAKKDISLMDLLEAGCSVAFHLAEFLGNRGIRAIYQEVDRLRNILDKHDSEGEAAESEEGGGIMDEMDRVYTDALTGLRKWEYFEDFIQPVYYDSKKCYTGDVPRFVFCCEMSNLGEINRKYGNDAGDKAYRKFTDVLASVIKEKGAENIALRDSAGVITGYITGVMQSMAAELLHKVLVEVRSIQLDGSVAEKVEVLFNAGVYREWKGSDSYKNIDVAKKIMLQMNDGVASHVGFLRNQEYVVTDKDFDRRGFMREGMISVLM